MNHTIKIYQIKYIVNTLYAFRDYTSNFNINDYDLIVEESYDSHISDEEICEIYFMLGNNGQLQNRYPDKKIRSISVSDIIEIDGIKYYVQNFGYKKLWEN